MVYESIEKSPCAVEGCHKILKRIGSSPVLFKHPKNDNKNGNLIFLPNSESGIIGRRSWPAQNSKQTFRELSPRVKNLSGVY